MSEKKSNGVLFEELLDIVARLRSEDGCPWDREQTRESLKPLMLEELYEAFDAIDRGDEMSLREELGDMLLHIIFHAQIGKEKGSFTIREVLEGIIYKMKERHPHVFGELQVKNVNDVLLNWEKIKDKEREEGESMLSSLPKSLPSLLRAFAIQSRVARVGFDWKNAREVEQKVKEEWQELREAWSNQDMARMEEEWGDLVFALVNLARHLDIQPEEALRKSCDRFVRRFGFIEEKIKSEGKALGNVTLEEMDALWEEAKKEHL